MKNLIENCFRALSKTKKKLRIIFPEGDNKIIQEVACELVKKNSKLEPLLVFKKKHLIPSFLLQEKKVFKIIIENNPFYQELEGFFYKLREGKTSYDEVKKLLKRRNYFATLLLKKGLADCLVGGIDYPTAEIIRPALQIIKTASKKNIAASSMLLFKREERLIFTDPAFPISTLVPKVEALRQMATLALEIANNFVFKEKNFAFLSYSTNGSVRNEETEIIRTASQKFKEDFCEAKDIFVAGEMQFDAAWNDRIREKKFPFSVLKKRANIFIFPDLNSANIGYKIMQQVAGYEVIGPIISGLNSQVSDLSRGATKNEVYRTVLLTAYLQLQKIKAAKGKN